MNLNVFFCTLIATVPLFVLAAFFFSKKAIFLANTFTTLGCLTLVGGAGGVLWILFSSAHVANDERAFTQACRAVVARGDDAALVATCVPHLDAVDAAEAAAEDARQADKNRADDDIVRARSR